jgi:hypothetical protein
MEAHLGFPKTIKENSTERAVLFFSERERVRGRLDKR